MQNLKDRLEETAHKALDVVNDALDQTGDDYARLRAALDFLNPYALPLLTQIKIEGETWPSDIDKGGGK